MKVNFGVTVMGTFRYNLVNKTLSREDEVLTHVGAVVPQILSHLFASVEKRTLHRDDRKRQCFGARRLTLSGEPPHRSLLLTLAPAHQLADITSMNSSDICLYLSISKTSPLPSVPPPLQGEALSAHHNL